MKAFLSMSLSVLSLWALTLDEAIERTMEEAPAIRKALSEVRYAQTGELEAQAAFHPTLDAGFQWQDMDETTTFGFSPSHHYNLSVKYNLFRGFADQAVLDAKEYDTEAQRLLVKASKADLKLEVIHAYAGYLKAVKMVQTQEEEFASLERSFNDTSIRYEQGMIAKNELLLIDVERLRAEQALNVAKSDLIRSRSNLRRVMGGGLESDEPIEDLKGEAALASGFSELLEMSYANRSELKALRKVRDGLLVQYRAAAGNFYPQVDISADYTVNDQERYSGTARVQVKEQVKTTLNVSWNLYNGRADEAYRRGMVEKVAIQDADIVSMKEELRYQLSDAYEAYRVAKSAQDVAARAKESAEENFRITSDRYEYGEADTLTMLTARSNLTAARNAYNNAYYDLYVAAAAIERISGE